MEKFADNVFLYQFFFFSVSWSSLFCCCFCFFKTKKQQKEWGEGEGDIVFQSVHLVWKHFLNALNLHREIEECLKIWVDNLKTHKFMLWAKFELYLKFCVRYVQFSQTCHICTESKKGCSCILYVIFIMQLLLNIMSSNLPGYLVLFIVYAFSKIHTLKTLIFFSTLFLAFRVLYNNYT